MVHAFDSSTWVTEAGHSVNSRLAKTSRTVRDTQRNPVKQNKTISLLFQRTGVQFQHPGLVGSQPPVTPVLRVPTPSSDLGRY